MKVSDGGGEKVYRPMAAPLPLIEDRVAALELGFLELEKDFERRIRKLERTNPSGQNRQDERVKRCIHCGKSLKNKRSGAQTCSDACRQAHYRVLKSSIATKDEGF